MGLLDRMYAKRKAKLVADAERYLNPGEVISVTGICQSEEQAALGLLEAKGWEQYLLIATDKHFYAFAISPYKNEVIDGSMEARTLVSLEARMDGRCAVIGEFKFAPARVESEPQDLVAFIREARGS